MAVLRFVGGWVIALAVLLLKVTCRIVVHDDPRPALRRNRNRYAYAILHGHQVGAVLAAEAGTAAMVSRSVDGDLLVPSLLVRRVVPVRGSTRHKGVEKGGAAALDELVGHVRGGRPAYLAVDGPRGPRGEVGRGIARLAIEVEGAVITAIPVPRRRWIFERAWDRFQVPKPFTRIDVYFGAVLSPAAGESVEAFRRRVEHELAELERRTDPVEFEHGLEAARRRREKLAREQAA